MLPQNKLSTLVGAGVGLALYLAVGLLPSILYGGYAGLLLAGGIVGTPVEPTAVVRGLTVFGMVLAVVGVASLFAVIGAMSGAALTGLVALVSRKPVAQETKR